MFTIKYNRSTYHIDGIPTRTKSTGGDTGTGAVAYYAETTCGALTRGRLADGGTGEDLAEVLSLAAMRASNRGAKLCKNCEKAANEILDTGHTKAHIAAAALTEAAIPAERPAAPADEKLAVWSLIRRDAQDTVEPGDYVQMFVVAQSAEAARSWAYRRAVLDNKPAERVWLDSTGHDLLVSCFDAEVDADAETGVRETVVWQG
jgi:hypothetical protein